MERPLVLALLLAGLPAQEDQFAPVRLVQLGPLPAALPSLRIEPDGTLVGDLTRTLKARPAEVVLEADRRTPAAVVGAVVEQCRAAGVERVLFAAVLPGRDEKGCFTLVLPAPDAVADLDLRLHRDGHGVPPDSVGLHLRRIAAGFEQAGRPPLRLGLVVPGDAGFEAVLQVLAAVARAGVRQTVVRWQRTAAQKTAEETGPADLPALATADGARSGAFAMTLGPSPLLQVPAAAVPLPRPAVHEQPVGLLERAQASLGTPAVGGAGGLYGGRGRGLRGVASAEAQAIARATETGLGWLAREQGESGVWSGADGGPDLEATALALLAFLGDGQTLRVGDHVQTLCRGAGALMARQGREGRIGLPGSGSVPRHALATYALAEAYGLADDAALRGHLVDAIAWLEGQRLEDGGWNEGTPGAPADTLSTAWAHMALVSAARFRLPIEGGGGDLAAWFDEVVGPETGAHRMRAGDAQDVDPETAFTSTAAALFCRFFDGQGPKTTPIMAKTSDLLLSQGVGKEAVADPLRCYFTTYALYQMGGRHWQAWSKVLKNELQDAQVDEGEHSGSWAPPDGYTRVKTTALRVLTLEAYYRYTRLVR